HGIDVAADDLIVLADVDLVVLAAPAKQNIALLADLDANVRQPAVVTDTSGTKRAVVDAARGLPPRFTFVGGHPLGGAARGGLQHARAGLFPGRPGLLTAPHEKLAAFVGAPGATPRTMAAEAPAPPGGRLPPLPPLTPAARQ